MPFRVCALPRPVHLLTPAPSRRTVDLTNPRPPPTQPPTPSYKEWDEERKIAWLTEELATKRPLMPADMPMSDEARA